MEDKSKLTSFFNKTVRFSLLFIYLTILAGSIVRSTGSGMGCPDWPKCFGKILPPSSEDEISWKPNTSYQHGQIIIWQKSLLVARKSFQSHEFYSDENWQPYTKHSYATYNPVHTWVEYINRLIGALAGIPILLMAVLSFFFIKKNKWITVFSLLTLFMLLLVAWLGKLVVDGNLIPGQITLHMSGALIIILLLFSVLCLINKNEKINVSPTLKWLLLLAFLFSVIQILLGTQVREQVDEVAIQLPENRNLWVEQLNAIFPIHRSFSILVVALNGLIYFLFRKQKLSQKLIRFVLGFIVLEVITGIVLNYFSLPAFVQPAHLLLAMLIAGFQFYLWLGQLRTSRF